MSLLKKITLLILVIITLLVSLVIVGYSNAYNTSQRISFTGSNSVIINNVMPVLNTDTTKSNTPISILIKDGRIERIEHSGNFNNEEHQTTVIDGAGMYVSPGLIDAHVHIEDSAYLALALSYGITTVRGMRGNDRQIKWRDEIKNNHWLGSEFIVSSPILDTPNSDPFHQGVMNEKHAIELVTKYINQHYDLIKMYGDLPEEIFTTIKNTAKEHFIPVAKHGPYLNNTNQIKQLSEFVSLEHVENIYSNLLKYKYKKHKVEKLANAFKKIDVPIVTTLAVFDELINLAEQKHAYLAQAQLQYMNSIHFQLVKLFGINRWLSASENDIKFNKNTYLNLLKITKLLHDSGVKIAVGSDSGALIGQPGLSTIHEILLLTKAGISPHDALVAATATSGEAVNGKKIGSIIEGNDADLILLNENPLKNMETLFNPQFVISKGRLLDKRQLKNLRMNATKTESPITTASYLLVNTWKK